VLSQPDRAFTASEQPESVQALRSLFALLHCLTFELSDCGQIEYVQLEFLVQKFAGVAGSDLPIQKQLWPDNEAFVLKLLETWQGDAVCLARVLGAYAAFLPRGFEGAAAAALRGKLTSVALPRFALQTLAHLRDPGFVKRLVFREDGSYEFRGILWTSDGPLWKGLREETCKLLAEAQSNRAIQENAYELLHWFVLTHSGNVPRDPAAMKGLLSQQDIVDAIWNAATATQLGPYAVYQLKDLPDMLKPLKTSCKLPTWWEPSLETAGVIKGAVAGPPTPQNTTELDGA
jgi:hypothetical protein